MERFIVREPRVGADYPQGNQMIAFSANAGGSNMIPETIYFGGPFGPEVTNVPSVNQTVSDVIQTSNHHHMNIQRNMNGQHNINGQLNLNGQHNINAQLNMNGQHNINQRFMSGQQNINSQINTNGQYNMNLQQNTDGHLNTIMNMQQNVNGQHNMNLQIAQQGVNSGVQGHMSGIDPRYLAAYTDNSAQFIVGQQIQRNTPINSIGSEYQNHSFAGIDRNKHKSSAQHASAAISKVLTFGRGDNEQNQQPTISMPPPNKPNGLDLLRNDIQNQIPTRVDKLKALYKSGPRSFSGPVEKVLKWHKSLQDIGILVFYEIVAKCVSVHPGKSCSKNLVVRDDNGPAIQVVYYEIDFLLPELKPPCTIRVIGRMMAGTCRLQAFNVRPATGDDVATLPRRAAVAAHRVAKLCEEYGPNAPHVH